MMAGSRKQVLQPQPGDLEDLLERGGDFLVAGVGQTLRERAEDRLLLVLPGANDERKPETRLYAVL